jgi:membrane protease YdiL (CAAX protease family)
VQGEAAARVPELMAVDTAARPGTARVPRLQPDLWVGLLQVAGWPAVLALMAAATIWLILSGHIVLAVMGWPGAALAWFAMQQAPWKVPTMKRSDRNLVRVQAEVRPLLVYALVYPLLEVPAVLWCLHHPGGSLLGGWSTSPQLSVSYVVLVKLVMLGLPAILFARALGSTSRQLGLRKVLQPWRWLAPVPAILLMVSVIGVLTLGALPRLPPPLWVALVAVGILHAGFPEEVFYRVLLQTRLELLLGSRSGVAVASLLFGWRHLPPRLFFLWLPATGSVGHGLLLTAATVLSYHVLIGMVFGYMWVRYRNAWVNIAGHTLFDVVAFLGLVNA